MRVRARPLGWDADQDGDDWPPTLDGVPEFVVGELTKVPVHSALGGVNYVKYVVGDVDVDPKTVEAVPPAFKWGDSWETQERDSHGRFGSGGGEMSDKPAPRASHSDSIEPHLATIQSRAASFFQDPSNKVEVLGSSDPDQRAKLEEYREQVRQQDKDYIASIEGRPTAAQARTIDGIGYMGTALRHGKTEGNIEQTIVATHDGVPVAAMCFERGPSFAGGDEIRVDYLGSNQSTRGAATAIQYQLARVAAEAGLRVESSATEDAVPYHQSVGRVVNELKDSTWSAEDVQKIAALDVGAS